MSRLKTMMDFGKKKEKGLIGLSLIKKLKTLNIVKMMFISNGSMMAL